MAETAEIRLLGELEVVQNGRLVPLPASKRTRALLGYLAVTGRAHSREHLCDLLWQGPDDPRAALRWSLAKIRTVLGPEGLVADREKVALGPVATDLGAVLGATARGADSTPVDELVAVAERFRGELLEGLSLPDCYRYHEWFVAEREAGRALRVSVVSALVEREATNRETALRWARELVALDPFSEAAHVRVIRLLGELGRRREALDQFETCRRILAEEAKARPSKALLEARMRLSAGPPAESELPEKDESEKDEDLRRPEPGYAPATVPLVGRAPELERMGRALERARRGNDPHVVLLTGEPGIGKSRLLAEIARRTAELGGTVLYGRAFEAEMVRPYGPWIDALRAIPKSLVPEPLRDRLATLVPGLDGSDEPQNRASLFDAVANVLVHLASSREPVVVLLDDIHWFDEASAGLLHYVSRALAGTSVFIACAARSGELADNVAALHLVRALGREHRSETLELGPLDAASTAELVRAVAPEADHERAVRDSAGNPLFAVEVARALMHDADGAWESIAGLIAERLSRLERSALELASWAAALGKRFDLAMLERVTGTSPVDLLGRVGELERRGVIRASSDGTSFDFVHDLVRTGAYRRLSEPARRVVHRQIARSLASSPVIDPTLAGDVAQHAELGGDPALVARAALVAAQRCARVFAGAEAKRLANLGLSHVDALSHEERLPVQLALLEVLVYSGTPERKRHRLRDDLARTVAEAERAGHHTMAAKGLHALSVLQFDGGDLAGAHENTLRAAVAVGTADPLARARQLADSGRCLATLERDMDRAEEMMAEATRIAGTAGKDLLELRWGAGVLDAFRGRTEDAVTHLLRALEQARAREDRWVEYECLRQLVQIELEDGTPTTFCDELLGVAAKMTEGSELASAEALDALVRLVKEEPSAEERVERSLTALRDLDGKGMLAYVLAFAAEHDVRSERWELAERRATEALEAATAVNRRSQAAVARVVLGRVALARNDTSDAARHARAARGDTERSIALSRRAWRAVRALEAEIAAAGEQALAQ